MSSQYGEHKLILRHFDGRVGTFVDVGAGDGVTYSNTALLVAAGWSGYMIEPAPSNLVALYAHHGDNPKVHILPCAIIGGKEDMVVKSLWDHREYSTLSPSHRERINKVSGGVVVFRQRYAIAMSWGYMPCRARSTS